MSIQHWNIKRSLCICMLIGAGLRLAAQTPAVRASVYHWRVPVLIAKANNPVIRIRITVPAGEPVELRAIPIRLEGTDPLKDLKTIRIFYGAQDSSLTRFDAAGWPLFGASGRLGKEVLINGHLLLNPGVHEFWVSYELNRKAGLLHTIGGSVPYLLTDGQQAGVSDDQVQQTARIGIAVRQSGQDGVHTSRIPGLVTTSKGTLLAIFDARYERERDLQGDIDIGLHRSMDGGQSWEPIRIAMDRGEWGGLPQKFNGVSDACILTDDKTGTIYIAGLWMYGVLDKHGKWIEGLTDDSTSWNHQWRDKGSQPGFEVKQTAQFLLVKSTDDGKTWSEPVNITRMCKRREWWLLAPAPGRGITMEDGTLVFPSQGRDESGRPFSCITYSRDKGRTWQTGTPALLTPEGTTECAVVELSDHSLMLNMRANKNRGNLGDDNGRAVALTHDLGKTWSPHPSSFGALPEPTCMGSLYKHPFSRQGEPKSLLFFSNPNSKIARDSMTVKMSTDEGMTWPKQYWVLLDEGKSRGYSCITSLDKDHIGILYESSQADLVFQKIKVGDPIKKTVTK